MSELLETEPYGEVEQDQFLNGALKLWTTFSPEELLERIHEIEQEAGRALDSLGTQNAGP